MPAKAGIKKNQVVTKHWTPAFAGVTTSYGFIFIAFLYKTVLIYHKSVL